MKSTAALDTLDIITVCVRLIALSMSVIGILRFGPALLKMASIFIPRKSRKLGDRTVRHAAWCIVAFSSLPYSVAFFSSVYGWKIPLPPEKVVNIIGLCCFCVAITFALIGTTIEERGGRQKCPDGQSYVSPGAIFWVCGIFWASLIVISLVLLYL